MSAKRKTKKRRRRQAATAFFVILFATAGVILSLTVFFPVKEVRVEGHSLYGEEEIIANSGIKVGDNLFRFNATARSKAIWTSLPYIENVHIRRTLAGVVVIEVTEIKHLFAIPVDSGVAVVSGSLKILQVTAQPPDQVVTLRGVQARNPKVGQTLETEDKAEIAFFSELLDALKKYELLDGVNEIDLSDRLNGTLIYENRFQVMIGTAHDLDYKISMLREMIMNRLRPGDSGFIDVATVATTRRGFFRPGDIRAGNDRAEP